jgi:hypothetical protein
MIINNESRLCYILSFVYCFSLRALQAPTYPNKSLLAFVPNSIVTSKSSLDLIKRTSVLGILGLYRLFCYALSELELLKPHNKLFKLCALESLCNSKIQKYKIIAPVARSI